MVLLQAATRLLRHRQQKDPRSLLLGGRKSRPLLAKPAVQPLLKHPHSKPWRSTLLNRRACLGPPLAKPAVVPQETLVRPPSAPHFPVLKMISVLLPKKGWRVPWLWRLMQPTDQREWL